jgi:hypothetical protein
VVLFCVLDAGVHMPSMGRPLQLLAAFALMGLGGCEHA